MQYVDVTLTNSPDFSVSPLQPRIDGASLKNAEAPSTTINQRENDNLFRVCERKNKWYVLQEVVKSFVVKIVVCIEYFVDEELGVEVVRIEHRLTLLRRHFLLRFYPPSNERCVFFACKTLNKVVLWSNKGFL